MIPNARVWNFRGLLNPPSRSQFEHRQCSCRSRFDAERCGVERRDLRSEFEVCAALMHKP